MIRTCDMRAFGSCEGPVRAKITWVTDLDPRPNVITQDFCDLHGLDLLLMIQDHPWMVIAWRAESILDPS